MSEVVQEGSAASGGAGGSVGSIPKGFDYVLPKERIAQWPAAASGKRSSAKLLFAKAGSQIATIDDLTVTQLPELLQPRDLLIVNNSRVLARRYFVRFPEESNEREILLLPQERPGAFFEALARPMGRFSIGDRFELCKNVTAAVSGFAQGGTTLELELVSTDIDLPEALDRGGVMPIPPYIRKGRSEDRDREYYQTIYSTIPGSVAAPTAGLHFTPELLREVEARGVGVGEITLHVGSASFRSAVKQDPNLATAEVEYYQIQHSLWDRIRECKASGGRVVAVGTTSVRALESYALLSEEKRSEGMLGTNLLITPGYKFRVVDLLFTNFHQPGSTHLLLVSAFFGEPPIRQVYDHALAGTYRFLSYGDAMLLMPARQGHESL